MFKKMKIRFSQKHHACITKIYDLLFVQFVLNPSV